MDRMTALRRSVALWAFMGLVGRAASSSLIRLAAWASRQPSRRCFTDPMVVIDLMSLTWYLCAACHAQPP